MQIHKYKKLTTIIAFALHFISIRELQAIIFNLKIYSDSILSVNYNLMYDLLFIFHIC